MGKTGARNVSTYDRDTQMEGQMGHKPFAIPMLLLLSLCFSTGEGQAQIVALGASNTAGKGVSIGEAFPAQLQEMLRARGLNVNVTNAGVSGDTPTGMLNRLNTSVPEGTRVVILNPGGNDLRACRRRGGGECASREEHFAVVEEIRARLRSRGIKVVMAKFGGMGAEDRQSDGRHLIPEVHREVASRLLPQVISALGVRSKR